MQVTSRCGSARVTADRPTPRPSPFENLVRNPDFESLERRSVLRYMGVVNDVHFGGQIMHALLQSSPMAAIARVWERLGNRLLGATARAGQLIADADTRLVGFDHRWRRGLDMSSINHVRAITA